MTPEQVEQLFEELRETAVGTRIKFHLEDANTTIEGVVIEPPGESPMGLDDGIFLQDVEDFTQIYCLCPDKTNGVGNILVHTFIQAPPPADRADSPEYTDAVSKRLSVAKKVTRGGGATGEAYADVHGVVDTNAPQPAPMQVSD